MESKISANENSNADQQSEGSQNDRESNTADFLTIPANLFVQVKEPEKYVQDSITINKELLATIEEKDELTVQLIAANRELAYQNKEREKRAAELLIANEEMAYQNLEKEKRAAELIVANRELAYQNLEKEKRAQELIIANSELKVAEESIRILNEELEHKVTHRTAQLEAANKELGSFSYSVSHDLRAPIRAINGYSKILLEDYLQSLDKEGEKILNAIIHNSQKMGVLIDDLLAFSKLGRKPVTFDRIDMDSLVRAVSEELIGQQEQVVPTFEIEDLSPAMGDKSLVKQVWINLLSNAIKYSSQKKNTRIEIGSRKQGRMVRYYVKDYGAGFDMQYYDKLFGVFQRLHSQEEFEGTGIGLAIVQKIVHRHNGQVWGESILGESTTFYFTLPTKIK